MVQQGREPQVGRDDPGELLRELSLKFGKFRLSTNFSYFQCSWRTPRRLLQVGAVEWLKIRVHSGADECSAPGCLRQRAVVRAGGPLPLARAQGTMPMRLLGLPGLHPMCLQSSAVSLVAPDRVRTGTDEIDWIGNQ